MNPLRRSPHPFLLEVPARPWLVRLSARRGRRITLGDVPEEELDRIAARGFHGIWLMGAWTTGPRARRLALGYPDLLATYERLVPDWVPADVSGSAYSIAAYDPPPDLGGWTGLARFRERLAERRMGLMLDLVPNHHGVDHPWLDEHPDRLVRGTARDLAKTPHDWFVHTTPDGEDRIFAHGRDPHFIGWSDTVQIDHRRRAARTAMAELLLTLASRCDGLRCDVAMLPLPDVFEKTWGPGEDEEAGDFWAEAIAALRERFPDFVLMAEVYWGLGPRLCDAGFDFAYDKELYDALVADDLAAVRARLGPGAEELSRGVHFLENHDEPRARPTFGARVRGAAAIAWSLPGLRFVQDGQAEGWSERCPVQLGRGPDEPVDEELLAFHERLLGLLAEEPFHRGRWTIAPVLPESEGGEAPAIVASAWTLAGEGRAILANLSDAPAKGRVALPAAPGSDQVTLHEDLTGESWPRTLTELRDGVLVELPARGVQVFRFPAGPAD
jgi:hypothetical protein